tara:strand:- start:592 stop:786 length:195 start_codon:yes stop_codon:yes gene_type:complete
MAELIKEIDKLPLREQELILSQLSNSFCPVEIDDVIYMIPEEVSELIDSLTMQLSEMRDAVRKN